MTNYERRASNKYPTTLKEAYLVIDSLRKQLAESRQLNEYDQKTGALSEWAWRETHYKSLESELSKYRNSSPAEQTDLPRHMLCFIDMNGLKQINDTLGYSAGDEAIVLIAKAIKEALREEDLIFRVNTAGDEFIVVARLYPSERDYPDLNEEICARINKSVEETSSNKLSVSLGYALLEDYESLGEATSCAEANMKRDKAEHYKQMAKLKFIAKLATFKRVVINYYL